MGSAVAQWLGAVLNVGSAEAKWLVAVLRIGSAVAQWLGAVLQMGSAVAQWLWCCATNRKVADSIPADVSGFFIDRKSFRSHYGPGVDSACNRNEYQNYFLVAKADGA